MVDVTHPSPLARTLAQEHLSHLKDKTTDDPEEEIADTDPNNDSFTSTLEGGPRISTSQVGHQSTYYPHSYHNRPDHLSSSLDSHHHRPRMTSFYKPSSSSAGRYSPTRYHNRYNTARTTPTRTSTSPLTMFNRQLQETDAAREAKERLKLTTSQESRFDALLNSIKQEEEDLAAHYRMTASIDGGGRGGDYHVDLMRRSLPESSTTTEQYRWRDYGVPKPPIVSPHLEEAKRNLRMTQMRQTSGLDTVKALLAAVPTTSLASRRRRDDVMEVAHGTLEFDGDKFQRSFCLSDLETDTQGSQSDDLDSLYSYKHHGHHRKGGHNSSRRHHASSSRGNGRHKYHQYRSNTHTHSRSNDDGFDSTRDDRYSSSRHHNSSRSNHHHHRSHTDDDDYDRLNDSSMLTTTSCGNPHCTSKLMPSDTRFGRKPVWTPVGNISSGVETEKLKHSKKSHPAKD